MISYQWLFLVVVGLVAVAVAAVLHDGFVDDVPGVHLALEVLHTLLMCFFMRASSTSFVAVPPEPLENSHDGFWLCQTRVWPRTFIWLVIAKLTIASAVA